MLDEGREKTFLGLARSRREKAPRPSLGALGDPQEVDELCLSSAAEQPRSCMEAEPSPRRIAGRCSAHWWRSWLAVRDAFNCRCIRSPIPFEEAWYAVESQCFALKRQLREANRALSICLPRSVATILRQRKRETHTLMKALETVSAVMSEMGTASVQ